MNFLTKAELYKSVDKLMFELNIKSSDYPLDSVSLAKKFFVDAQILYKEFDLFCALLYRGKKTTTLALNSKRTPQMQNFDCMHEIIHYFLHNDVNSFQCLSGDNLPSFNDRLEWQANEGAAQALLPYRLFIPMYAALSEKGDENLIKSLAASFGVTERVVLNRIDNLKYEIYQYKILKKSLKDIEILSKSSCEQKNFPAFSNDKIFCANCRSLIENDANFCPVCGNKLSSKTNFSSGFFSAPHSSVKLLDDMRVEVCPVCSNREISRSSFYCKICGAPTANRCTNASKTDAFGFSLDFPCGGFLEGNARFCPFCGSESTFLKAGILKKIN